MLRGQKARQILRHTTCWWLFSRFPRKFWQDQVFHVPSHSAGLANSHIFFKDTVKRGGSSGSLRWILIQEWGRLNDSILWKRFPRAPGRNLWLEKATGARMKESYFKVFLTPFTFNLLMAVSKSYPFRVMSSFSNQDIQWAQITHRQEGGGMVKMVIKMVL